MDIFRAIGAFFELLLIPSHLEDIKITRESLFWTVTTLILFGFAGVWVYLDTYVWPYETEASAIVEEGDLKAYQGQFVEVQGFVAEVQLSKWEHIYTLRKGATMEFLDGEGDITVRRGDRVGAVCYIAGEKEVFIVFRGAMEAKECHSAHLIRHEVPVLSSKKLHKAYEEYEGRRVLIEGELEEGGLRGSIKFDDFFTDVEEGSKVSVECYVEHKKGLIFSEVIVSDCSDLRVLSEPEDPIWKVW